MILGKFWDRELVEAVLAYFKGREISDQLVVSAVNGGFAKEGTVFTEVEKFMQPEVIEALYKRMKFVPELTADLFDQVLKMSLVVGLDRLDQVSQEVQQAFGDQLMAVSSGFGSMDVAKHLAPSHQEGGVYQVIEEYLGLTPWEQVKGKK